VLHLDATHELVANVLKGIFAKRELFVFKTNAISTLPFFAIRQNNYDTPKPQHYLIVILSIIEKRK